MKTVIQFAAARLQAMDFADAAERLPLRSDLFGVRHRSGGAPWCSARLMAGGRPLVALSSVCRARVSIRCRRKVAVRSTFVTLELCRNRWLGRPSPYPRMIVATRIPVRMRTAQRSESGRSGSTHGAWDQCTEGREPLLRNGTSYLPEYRNPQQEESGGQSRMLLVMVVAFALILISQFVFFKNKPNHPACWATRANRQGSRGGCRSRSCGCYPGNSAVAKFDSRKDGHSRSRDRGRERSLPHRFHQPWRAGQIMDPEEI